MKRPGEKYNYSISFEILRKDFNSDKRFSTAE